MFQDARSVPCERPARSDVSGNGPITNHRVMLPKGERDIQRCDAQLHEHGIQNGLMPGALQTGVVVMGGGWSKFVSSNDRPPRRGYNTCRIRQFRRCTTREDTVKNVPESALFSK